MLVIVTTIHDTLLISNEYLEQAHMLSKCGKGGAWLNPINYDATVVEKLVILLTIVMIIETLLCEV